MTSRGIFLSTFLLLLFTSLRESDEAWLSCHQLSTRKDACYEGLLLNDAAEASGNDLACAWYYICSREQYRVYCCTRNDVDLSCALFHNILLILFHLFCISGLIFIFRSTWLFFFLECLKSEKMRRFLLCHLIFGFIFFSYFAGRCSRLCCFLLLNRLLFLFFSRIVLWSISSRYPLGLCLS